jgi:hypothetical protein
MSDWTYYEDAMPQEAGCYWVCFYKEDFPRWITREWLSPNEKPPEFAQAWMKQTLPDLPKRKRE